MWRTTVLIRHNCGEFKYNVGHRWLKETISSIDRPSSSYLFPACFSNRFSPNASKCVTQCLWISLKEKTTFLTHLLFTLKPQILVYWFICNKLKWVTKNITTSSKLKRMIWGKVFFCCFSFNSPSTHFILSFRAWQIQIVFTFDLFSDKLAQIVSFQYAHHYWFLSTPWQTLSPPLLCDIFSKIMYSYSNFLFANIQNEKYIYEKSKKFIWQFSGPPL